MKNTILLTVIVTVMILSPMLANGGTIQEKKPIVGVILSANTGRIPATEPIKSKGSTSPRGAPKQSATTPVDTPFTLALKGVIADEVEKTNGYKNLANKKEIENGELKKRIKKFSRALDVLKSKYDSLYALSKYQEKLATDALNAKDGTIAELNRLRTADAEHIKNLQEEIENFKVEIGRIEKMRDDEQERYYGRLGLIDEIMFEHTATILVDQSQIIGGILFKTARKATPLNAENTQNVDKDRITRMYFYSMMPGDITTYKFKLTFTNKYGVVTVLFTDLLADTDQGVLSKELPIDYLKKQIQNYEKGKFTLQLYYEENEVPKVRKNFDFVLSKK